MLRYRAVVVYNLLFLSCLAALAKDKKKSILPLDVLQAHTAWVVVDPQAGVDVTDPLANRTARAAVESALANWGRLSPVTGQNNADLVIVVRKGNGKLVQPTIGGSPVDAPPPVIGQRRDTGSSAGGRAGPPFESSDPRPQIEVADAQDTFVVYRGNRNNDDLNSVLDSPAVWRYSAQDALAAPNVLAVEAFRKAITESEKALAKKP